MKKYGTLIDKLFKRFVLITLITYGMSLLFIFVDKVILFSSLGTLVAFFLFQVLQFLLKKFLSKELRFNEFSYVTAALSVVIWDFIYCIFFPSACLFINLTAHKEIIAQKNDIFIIILNNPICWMLFSGLIIFSYRIGFLKKKLIDLQYNF